MSGLSEAGHAGGEFPRPDLHERLQRVLDKYKPDLIFSCYGMNCGIHQPVSDQRFLACQKGNEKLKSAAKKVGAEVIFVPPPFYDDHGKSKSFNYDDLLFHYSKWLVSKRADGWNAIDQNSAMTAAIKGPKVLEPKFTVQKDTVHPNKEGHLLMAQSLINYYSTPTSTPNTNAQVSPVHPAIKEASPSIKQKQKQRI